MQITRQDSYAFNRFLPYYYFDQDGDMFFNVDGSLGVIWKIRPVACETMLQEELATLSSKLSSIFKVVPEGTVCQFIVFVNKKIDEARYMSNCINNEIIKEITRSRINSLKSLQYKLGGQIFRSRNIRLFFTIRIDPAYIKPSIKDIFQFGVKPKSFCQRVGESYNSEKKRLLEIAMSCENLFSQLGIEFSRLNESEAVRLLVSILNPPVLADSIPVLTDADERPLRERILKTNVHFDFSNGLIKIGSYNYKLVSATELPAQTYAGMISDVISFMNEGLVVINVNVQRQLEVKKFLNFKKKLAFCQQKSGDYKADLYSVKQEVDDLLTEMFQDNTRIVSSRIHLIVRDENADDLNQAFSATQAHLASLGILAIQEDALALTLFIQSLPLAYNPENDRGLKRSRQLKDINLAHLIPVYSSFLGTRSEDLLLLNRHGLPVNFSFFETNIAAHGIICGVSGSGKSVLANNLIISALKKGAYAFVIDKGNSYKKLTHLLGGEYIKFNPDEALCINPFGSRLTKDKQVFLIELISEMITCGRSELSIKERNLIAMAIQNAFEMSKGQEVTTSMVKNALKAIDEPEARALSLCLEMFTARGPYAKFFDGPCSIKLDKKLTVFELDDVALNKEAASVILMSIIEAITAFCISHPESEKYLIIDEAWTLLRSSNTARFIENVFRTYRKYRTSAIIVTQQVTDFDGKTGEAIRANAPNRIFLRQTSETIQTLATLLDLKQKEKEILKSLCTVKGLFSEMLILTPNVAGVARLVQDPYSYWLTTTDPADCDYLAGLINQSNGDLGRALQIAARQQPCGVNRV